jgi:hypothetical protein
MKILMALNHRKALLSSIKNKGVLFEWGTGGTSKWIAQRLEEGQRLISIEHSKEWASKAKKEAEGLPWDIHHVAIEHEGQNATPFEECPSGSLEYITAFRTLQPNIKGEITFLVDGVARGACLIEILTQYKEEFTIFIHDTHRSWYDWAMAMFPGDWEFIPYDEGEYPAGMTRYIR